MTALTIAIAGNPNCGKTTLFNTLTGTHQHVGNWPGVTVEKKVGTFSHQSINVNLVDLPGVYSLSVAGDDASLDERIARDFILTEQPDLVVNVLDASNLERNLYLTVQLLEMGTPVVVALNMMDIAASRKIQIETHALSQKLGCPVVGLIAAENTGIGPLKDLVIKAANNGLQPSNSTVFSPHWKPPSRSLATYPPQQWAPRTPGGWRSKPLRGMRFAPPWQIPNSPLRPTYCARN